MKKVLLIIAAILMSASVFAQTRTTFISEHFDGNSLPIGWQASGSGTSNWSITATQNAGGEANELRLSWDPQFNGTSRMVMPEVDLTGVESVVVSFKHALDNYSGSHTIGIATSSDGGNTWNVGWQQSYSSSNSWEVTQLVSTSDMGNSAVKLCIFYTGNSYNINYWYFDNIEIFSQENLDAAISSIDMNSVLGAGTKEIACTVLNKGAETVNQITMAYQIDNEAVVEETFDVNLTSLASTSLTFTQPVTLLPGSHNLTISLMAVNGVADDDPDNNVMEKNITIALGETQKIAMIEHFSSSTCSPCVQPNVQMHNVTTNNPGKFTYTKYQMNWPGNGDPYYTNEGGTRRQFYGVNAVPMIFIDAQEKSASQAAATINNIYESAAFADIRGSFNVSGNTITIKVDFMSYYDNTTSKAFVSINEKETHNNVGSNGETSFHHIFMKFATSAQGDEVNIPAGGYQHFEFTQDLSGTHVEEMSDLEVSAWLQEYGTKEIINSHFLYEYTDVHPYPVQSLSLNAEEGVLTATWAAPEGGNALSYNVYLNGELAENTTSLEYTATVTEEFNVVSVEAVYENDMTSVKMVQSTVSAPAPQTELTLSATEIVFGDPNESITVTITNNTAEDVTINEITEDGTHYLIINTSETLPYVLTQGSGMDVTFTPVAAYRELVTTNVNIVSTIGTQTVSVTVDNSWTGVDENGDTSYEIYPNPTNGNIMVKGDNINKVEVYNLCGQKVMSVKANSNNVNVEMSALTTGVYMVKVIDNDGNATVNKVVKR